MSYWDTFYSSFRERVPSDFCRWVCGEYLTSPRVVVDIGCGNGRDASWMALRGHNVLAVDSCAIAGKDADPARFMACDALDVPGTFDVVYSRWFLHAIPYDAQLLFIKSLSSKINKNGLLALEFRTTDEGCDGHSRWPITLQAAVRLFNEFTVIHASEGRNRSVLGSSNPPLGRIIATA